MVKTEVYNVGHGVEGKGNKQNHRRQRNNEPKGPVGPTLPRTAYVATRSGGAVGLLNGTTGRPFLVRGYPGSGRMETPRGARTPGRFPIVCYETSMHTVPQSFTTLNLVTLCFNRAIRN